MAKYVCDACGWEYDEELGSPENGIAPGTKFADLPDVLTVAQLSAATGYNVRTVGQWLRRGRMQYITLDRAYHVPKRWAIDYLCSDQHNSTHRKSPQHVAALWAAYEGGVTA